MRGDPVAGERAPRQARKRTTPLVNGLLIALALAVGFVLFTWFAAGPLKSAQIDQNLNRTYPIDAYRGWLVALDRIGQRAVCLPILAIVGVQDALLDSKGTRRRLDTQVARATVRMLPDAGHVIRGEIETIKAFLSGSCEPAFTPASELRA